jgi:IclR family pca regulon transcriptional regulator
MPRRNSNNVRDSTADCFLQSFARGLLVLRSFDAEAPQQTIAEVATKTGIDRAGARRILHTLETLGYVRRENHNFYLTPRVLSLGYAYFATTPAWAAAERLVQDFVKEIRETSSIGVLDEGEVLYVVRVPAPRIVTSTLTVGSRLPAYCSSTGRQLLAALPDQQLKRALRGMNIVKRTSHTVTSVTKLTQIIRREGRQGWSLVNQELESGLNSIAVPILDKNNEPMAAVNVSGSTAPDVLVDKVLPLVKRLAGEIAQCVRIQQPARMR